MRFQLVSACGLAWVSVFLSSCGDGEPPPPPDPLTAFVCGASNASRARPCRSDVFFGEISLDTETTAVFDLLSIPGAEMTMTPSSREERAWLFCDPSAFNCVTRCAADPPVTARLEPLLPPLTGEPYHAARVQAEGRFLRFSYRDASGAIVPVLERAHCHVVEKLRNTVEAIAPANSTVFVGRECDATVLSFAEANPTLESRAWHLARLGRIESTEELASTPDTEFWMPANGDESTAVDVALIDSGIRSDIEEAIGAETVCPSEPEGICSLGAFHVHGTAMALLVRQLAPRATIRAYHALELGGSGSTSAVALALDRAMIDAFAGDHQQRPLVINMSIGWPNELACSSTLGGDALPMLVLGNTYRSPACQTVEDPIGESVRYLLHLARERTPPAVVVAAAGNRPTRHTYSELFRTKSETDPEYCDNGQRRHWFYPAEWDQRRSDPPPDSTDPTSLPLSIAVAALDAKDRFAAVSIPGLKPDLAAPGEHVYVWTPSLSMTIPGRVCAGDGDSLLQASAYASFSGTSVAAALTSGVIARAQERLRALGSVFEPDEMKYLLKATGTELPYDTLGGRVRRVNLAKIMEIFDRRDLEMTPGPCAQAISCLQTNFGECDTDLAACLVGWTGSTEVAFDPRWPEGAPVCATMLTSPTDPPAVSTPCIVEHATLGAAGATCGLLETPDRMTLGSTGPQPQCPICTDCRLAYPQSMTGEVVLSVDISTEVPSTTEIVDPTLIITWVDAAGTTKEAEVALTGYEDAEGNPFIWKAGASGDIPIGVALLEDVEWDDPKPSLRVTLTPQQGSTAVDVSALRFEEF